MMKFVGIFKIVLVLVSLTATILFAVKLLKRDREEDCKELGI